jgi:O-antigen ligase
MANDRPFTGVGHNAFIPAYGQYDPSRGASFGSGRSVHSTWFGALAELGYPGLALLLVNLALAVRACSRVRKLARRGEIPEDLGKFATALESSFVPFAVGGTFVVFQYNEMVWHYIGLTIALDAIAREEARAAPSPAAAPAAPALAGAKGTP